MIDKLANLTTRRPGRVLIVAALVSLLSLAISSGLPGRLASQGFADEGAESHHALDSIAIATGFDPTEDMVAVVTAPKGQKITSAAGRKRAAEVAAELQPIDGVHSVVNPLAEGVPPELTKASISENGRSVIITVHTLPHAQDGETAEIALAEVAAEDVQLGGSLVAQHYVTETVSNDLQRSELIAFPLLFVISLFVFRSLFAAALPLVIGAITIPLTLAMVSFYNEITSLSVFALNLTTGLGLGLAIDYALLTITRYREELATGAEPPEALRTTMHTAGRTIVFSALTVAGAILVLGIFPLKFLYSMAFAGSTVALASAVVSLTVLPAALMLLGPRIDRFSLARKPADAGNARWYKLATGVMRRPVLVGGTVTLLILILVLPIRNLSFTSVDASVLPADNQAHVVQQRLAEEFPQAGSSTVMVAVDATERQAGKVAELAEQITKLEDVTGVSSPLYLGLNTWRLDVQTRELYYEPSALDTVDEIRALPGAQMLQVGGITAAFVDQREAILELVPLTLLLILLITFVVLFLLTGSVVLPVKTFIMNLLTLAATFGILTWIFGEGHLEGLLDYKSQDALEMTQPVLLFVIAFALATDYGCFLLGRITELHQQGLESDEAVARGVSRTGRVITLAALLFCVAIGAFSLSDIVFIKELGVGAALAVAIDATLIRALLVPSLMALLGDWNWWAPKPLRRLHQRFGLSEGPPAAAADAQPEAA